MALIKCPECGNTVSDKAEACPNCGFPITNEKYEDNHIENANETKNTNQNANTKKTRKKMFVFLIILLAIIAISSFLIVFFISKSNNDQDIIRYYNEIIKIQEKVVKARMILEENPEFTDEEMIEFYQKIKSISIPTLKECIHLSEELGKGIIDDKIKELHELYINTNKLFLEAFEAMLNIDFDDRAGENGGEAKQIRIKFLESYLSGLKMRKEYFEKLEYLAKEYGVSDLYGKIKDYYNEILIINEKIAKATEIYDKTVKTLSSEKSSNKDDLLAELKNEAIPYIKESISFSEDLKNDIQDDKILSVHELYINMNKLLLEIMEIVTDYDGYKDGQSPNCLDKIVSYADMEQEYNKKLFSLTEEYGAIDIMGPYAIEVLLEMSLEDEKNEKAISGTDSKMSDLEIHAKAVYTAAQSVTSKMYSKSIPPCKKENHADFSNQVKTLSEMDKIDAAIAYIKFKSSDGKGQDSYKIEEIIYSDDGEIFIKKYTDGEWEQIEKEKINGYVNSEWIVISNHDNENQNTADIDNEWISLYMDMVTKHKNETSDTAKYKLLYINDDNIPEMWVSYGDEKNKYFYTVSNGKCEELQLKGNAGWNKKENLVCDFYETGVDEYEDDFYIIEKGKYVLKVSLFTELVKVNGVLTSRVYISYDGKTRREASDEEYVKYNGIIETWAVATQGVVSYEEFLRILRSYSDNPENIDVDKDFYDWYYYEEDGNDDGYYYYDDEDGNDDNYDYNDEDGNEYFYKEGSNEWASLYLEKLREHKDEVTDETKCKLLYINDDETPELWMYNGYKKTKYMFTAYEGRCDEVELYGEISGAEYSNMFNDSYGGMGYYGDELYKIENGKFVKIASGESYEEYNSEDSGYSIEYIISGRGNVSFEEYHETFDIDNTFDTWDDVISYDQCLELLQD